MEKKFFGFFNSSFYESLCPCRTSLRITISFEPCIFRPIYVCDYSFMHNSQFFKLRILTSILREKQQQEFNSRLRTNLCLQNEFKKDLLIFPFWVFEGIGISFDRLFFKPSFNGDRSSDAIIIFMHKMTTVECHRSFCINGPVSVRTYIPSPGGNVLNAVVVFGRDSSRSMFFY